MLLALAMEKRDYLRGVWAPLEVRCDKLFNETSTASIATSCIVPRANKGLISRYVCEKNDPRSPSNALVLLNALCVAYFSQLNIQAFHGSEGGNNSTEGVHLCVCTIEKANSIVNRLAEETRLEVRDAL